MNINEAIETIKNIDTLNINDMIAGQQVDMVIKNQVLDIINQIDEPQKVTIPKFVAEWYEEHKENLEYDLYLYLMSIYDETSENNDFYYWMQKTNNPIQILINMHQFGYEVEKEQLYTVEIPNPNRKGNNRFYLHKDPNTGVIILSKGNFNIDKNKNLWLTESEIKQDFEWAWNAGFAKEVE